jgi:hypothetical protein
MYYACILPESCSLGIGNNRKQHFPINSDVADVLQIIFNHSNGNRFNDALYLAIVKSELQSIDKRYNTLLPNDFDNLYFEIERSINELILNLLRSNLQS